MNLALRENYIRAVAGLGLVLTLTAMGCSSSSGNSEPTPEEVESQLCAADHLENTVDASDWARDRAGIAAYRYVADITGGVARVDLLDESEVVLATMAVRQLFGDAEERDGSFEAILDEEGDSPLRLLTRGEDVTRRGYDVKMRLEDDSSSVHVDARFDTVRCWFEEDTPQAPACAGAFPLAEAGFVLPSCGAILDDRIRLRQPPELTELSYSVASDTNASVGGSSQKGAQRFQTLDVFGDAGAAEAEDVSQWLQETGADAIVSTERARLLTTAFLDRSWWRTLDQHVAECDVRRARPGESESEDSEDDLQTERMTLCPGDQDNDAWAPSSSSSESSVWGDPHIVSLDGYSYDLQASGEFVLVEAIEGEPFTVQGRFEPIDEPAVPECGNLSWNTAGATEVAGTRVMARVAPLFEVFVDGARVGGPDDLPQLPEGASISFEGNGVTVEWPGGEVVTFVQRGSTLADRPSLTIDVDLPAERAGQVQGLLGNFDGDPDNDLALPDGTVIVQPASFRELYEELAVAWRLDDQSSLFEYEEGEGPESFVIDGFPDAPVDVSLLPDDLAAQALQTCVDEGIEDRHLLDACIVDVVCLADPGQAAASANVRPPVSSQPPGREDVVVDGDVRVVSAPDAISSDPRAAPEQCAPDIEPEMQLFTEVEAHTLDADVAVELLGSGTLNRGGTPASEPIEEGTVVTSYTLMRRPADTEQSASGSVRFNRPILGVIVDSNETDEALGASATEYPSSAMPGVSSERDRISVSGARLDVFWTGDVSKRIRVLVDTSDAS